jgi:uncharacterized protein (DUF58 family)
MAYASAAALPTKRARADLLLLALAALLIRGGERVALLGSGLAPASGRAVLNRLALTLERDAPGTAVPGFEPLPRYGQVVMIGDLLAPLEEIQALVGRFAATGLRGHLLQVLDPAEETLPFAGRVRFEGMEQEGTLLVSRVETVREDYAKKLAWHRAGLADIARATGWSFAMHRTDRPPHTALLALFATLAEPRR